MPGYWRKPLSLMYDHNYRYGTGLYTGALDDAERRYRHALFRSHLSSDRPYYGSYLSYLTPSRTYWPTSTTLKSGPTKKTYFYYDIPYYSSYTSPYSSYISPYSYYTRLHYPSSYYSYTRPYYSSYRPYASSYYYSPYSSYYPYSSHYYSPYLDSDLYDLKRSRSDSNLLRRSYSMDDLSYKTADDYWVPLSSYLYRSPSAIDLTDYDTKSKKRWRELDDLEWQLKAGKTHDMYESSLWADKCNDFQIKLDSVSSRMAEAESAIKEEMLGSKGTFKTDLADLAYQLQETYHQNEELINTIKRQAKQLTNIQSNYDETCRQVDDAAEYLSKSRLQCEQLHTDLEELRKMASERTIRTTTICY